MDNETPEATTKPSPVRLNLKCPRERELLEKYYNERRVLDTSVPKEVITAFNLKTEKQAKTREKTKERLKNIIETDPERLERIREQRRRSKQKCRAIEKEQRLRLNDDNESQSTVVSSKLFPSSSERSFSTRRSECGSECGSEFGSECGSDTSEIPPPVVRKPNFFMGGMRF